MFGINSFAEAPFSALPGLTVYVALSGVSSTGSVGAETPAGKEADLTAVTGTGSVGSVVWQKVGVASGNIATGTVTDVGTTRTLTLSGTSSTTSVGNTIFSKFGVITGISVAGSAGSISGLTSTVQSSGVTGASSVGNVQAGKFGDLTVVTATGSVGFTVPSIVVTAVGVEALGSLGTLGVAPHWALVENPENVTWQQINSNASAGWTDIDSAVSTDWQLIDN